MREIALIGFAQTLFFSILILTKRKKEIKDYLLVVFLLFVGAELIYRFLINTVPVSQIKWITLIDIFYWAMFGPVTLLYIYFTIDKTKKICFIHLLHLIPLIVSLFAVYNYFIGDFEYKSFVEYFNNSSGITKVALYIWEFSSPLYLFYSLYILLIHKKSIKNYFSKISGKDIQWLIILISVFIFQSIIAYTIWFVEDIFHIDIQFRILDIYPLILTLYVFFFGYYGYKQEGIFFDYPFKKRDLINPNKKIFDSKYTKSSLSEFERKELINGLKDVMENEKLYMESDLNINMLAEKLDTSFHKLSQVINESFNQNFYDFVNKYRIREIKKLIKKPGSENYTLISHAYVCGFNTKSAFYTAFKKNTGMTPGDYFKKVKERETKIMAN